jgi:hypothetical protein
MSPQPFRILDIASQVRGVKTFSWPDKVFRVASTLVVPKELSAMKVAGFAEHVHASLVIVTEDHSAKIAGVVVPELVVDAVKKRLGREVKGFGKAVGEIEKEGRQSGRYHHEWLNEMRVGSYWCVQYDHFSPKPKCPTHGTPCDELTS